MPKRKPKAKTVQTASPRVNGARIPGPSGQTQSLDFCGVLHRYVPGVLGLIDWAYPSCAARDLAPEPQKKAPSNPKTATEKSAGLTVPAGQITFDGEGNDNASSRYFSRVLHWPGGASGVTLGRGYDMRERSAPEIISDLTSAGVPVPQATKCSEGAGLKGAKAADFVKENRKACGEVSHTQQKALFLAIYSSVYVNRARRFYNRHTASEPERLAWDDLSQPIRDILADLAYQGAMTSGAMKAAMRNDPHELAEYIRKTPKLNQYEKGRNRAGYLEQNAPADARSRSPLTSPALDRSMNGMLIA